MARRRSKKVGPTVSALVVLALLALVLTWLWRRVEPETRIGALRAPTETHAAAPAAKRDANAPAGSLRFVSFNGKHWGRAGQDIAAAAHLVAPLAPDVLALQEVNTGASGVTAVKRLAAELSTQSGGRYCTGFSSVPSGAVERYAILWKETRLAYVTTQGARLEGCPQLDVVLPLFSRRAETVVREPAYAQLEDRTTAARFLVATVHLVPSGKRPQDEVVPLFESLPTAGEPFSRLPIVLMGDFNLSAAHPVFAIARAAGYRSMLPPGTKTSLKMKKREMNKEYDLVFARGLACDDGHAVDVHAAFPDRPAKAIFNAISDHVPVTARCGFAALAASGPAKAQ